MIVARSTRRWRIPPSAAWLFGFTRLRPFRREPRTGPHGTHKVAIPQPVVDHEAEYDSVLVRFGDDGYDPQLISTAAELAARSAAGSTCW